VAFLADAVQQPDRVERYLEAKPEYRARMLAEAR